MHVALVTPYFPPEVAAPAQRAWDHARAWVEAGCRVSVVTGPPSHPYGVLYPGHENRRSDEVVDGVRVLRLPTLLGPNAGRFRRVASWMSFAASVAASAGRIGRPDVVVSTSPHVFAGAAGGVVARRYGAPWVLEIRDLWPESVVAVGASRPGPLLDAVAAGVRTAYRTCDRIVSVSPAFASHFAEAGVPEAKVAVIPNGVDTTRRASAPRLEEFPALAGFEGRFIAAYVGTLGMAHGAGVILDAAEAMRDDPRVGFVLMGSGAERDAIVRRVRERGADNVAVLDQQPRERAAALLSLASAAIVHLKDQPVFETVIPTKLLDGMAAARPVLLGVRGQARAILEEAGAGLAFEPENPADLVRAVQTLMADPQGAADMGRRGRDYVVRRFDRRALAADYLGLLREVAAQARDRAA